MKGLQPRRRPVLLPACQRPKRILAVSRAPVCLARETTRQKERLGRLRISCDWLKAEPRPRLLKSPLMGRCLADLTGPESGSPGEEERAAERGTNGNARHEMGRPTSGRPGGPVETPSAAGGRAGLPAQTGPDPRSLDCQARPELLSRLAGKLPRAVAARKEDRKSWLRTAPWVGRSRTADCATQEPAASSSAADRPAARLVERLANRAGKRLNRSGARLAAGQGETPVQAMTEALVRLWPGPLDGLAAPLALLERLAWPASGPVAGRPAEQRQGDGRRPRQAPEAARGAARERPSVAADGAVEKQPAAGMPAARVPAARMPAARVPGAGPHRAGSEAALDAHGRPEADDPSGFFPDGGVPPLPTTLPATRSGPARVAPPQIAENLPTLLPPRSVYDAPTPAASASLRRLAARDEEDLAGEDLGLLADKIKRILEEEARRHGIDV